MRKIKFSIYAALMLIFLCGCEVIIPVAILGGGGGYATYSVTADHIQDEFKITKEEAFETIIGMINSDEGAITLSSLEEGKIQARVKEIIYFFNVKDGKEAKEGVVIVSIRAKKHNELIPDKQAATSFYRRFVKEVMK